jgi:hypothetical protein
MKKALFVMLALVVIASFAFADGVTIGAWGRGIFMAVGSGGVDPMTHNFSSWGPEGGRIGFTVSGSSANTGFQADIRVEQGAINCGDVQKIWVKPISMLTIQFGRIYDDTVRGSASFGAFNWLRLGNMVGDGIVFSRIGENPMTANGGEPGVNFEISVAPVDGLFIFAAVGGNGIDLVGNTTAYKAADVFKNGQYGAGYTIPGIGMIRAQIVGHAEGVLANAYNLIQAAFKLTAVSGLTVDLGGFIPTDSTISDVVAGGALYANYGMGPLSLNAEANITLTKAASLMKLEGSVAASYTVDTTNNIGVEAAVNYQNKDFSGLANGAVGFLLDVTKGFSNGVIGIGFQGTTGNFATNWGTELLPKSAVDAFVWCIPIRVEYWF